MYLYKTGALIAFGSDEPKPKKELPQCDGCGRLSRSVESCGQDTNGDPDAPDLCFLCRVEEKRGRYYDRKLKMYKHYTLFPEG